MLFFYFGFLFLFFSLREQKVSIIVEQRFEVETRSAQRQNCGYHRFRFRPIASRDCWGTASQNPIASIGRRPLSYINLSVTTTILLQVPKSNTIYLGIFDSPVTVTNLFSSLLAYPNGFGLSQKSDTQYFSKTLDSSTGRLLHCFPEGYSIQIVQRRHIMEDSYGIDL